METRLPTEGYLWLSVTEGIIKVDPSDIIRLQASSNYTFIYFTNRPPLLIARVLKQFEDVLCGYGFIRTHRTHLINRRYVRSICHNGRIVMADASVAGISRRMKPLVMKELCAAA